MSGRRPYSDRLREPPGQHLRIFEEAAVNDYAVARIAVRLFDSILGTSCVFAGGNWRLHECEALPARLRTAGRALAAWGSRRGILLNDVICARQMIIAAIITMRRSSPFGRRRIRLALELRSAHPPRKPAADANSGQLQYVPVLCDDVGRPLSHGTIRRLSVFSPSRIEIRGAGESSYALASDAAYVTIAPDDYTVERITLAKTVPPCPVSRVIEGFLEDYFETGTEGVIWAVTDPDECGYDGLHVIEEGDRLDILDALGRSIWSGTIRCDRNAGWAPYPMNPKYGQPCALGHWIHWTQKGFRPDAWAKFFINSNREPFRAILWKKREPAPRNP